MRSTDTPLAAVTTLAVGKHTFRRFSVQCLFDCFSSQCCECLPVPCDLTYEFLPLLTKSARVERVPEVTRIACRMLVEECVPRFGFFENSVGYRARVMPVSASARRMLAPLSNSNKFTHQRIQPPRSYFGDISDAEL